jgi:sulfur transfer complex TusBCD TusB component (DsrH family)
MQIVASVAGEVTNISNERNNSSGDYALVTLLGSNCNNTSSYHYIAATGGADKFYLYGNGTYATVSDRRLKKNIESISDRFLQKVMDLNVVNFNWNEQEDGHKKEFGLIAQEVEKSFPFIVNDNRPNQNGEVFKNIAVSALPYILIKAIQELKQEIDTLKS